MDSIFNMIITNTPEDTTLLKEEEFGPAVNKNVFSTDDEVFAKANNAG